MDDEFDAAVAARFKIIDAVPVPDTWRRAAGHKARSTDAEAPRRRAVAMAAAVVLVVAGGGVLFSLRGDGGPPAARTGPPSSGTSRQSTSMMTPTTVEVGAFGTAKASPAIVQRGASLTVTPPSAIRPICTNLAVLHQPTAAGLEPVGQLATDGTYVPLPTSPTWPACLMPESRAAVTYQIPEELPDDTYVLCLTEPVTEEGCATFRVAPDDTSPPLSSPVRPVAVRAIEVRPGSDGGEDVVFVFDRPLPDDRVTYSPDITDIDVPGIAYATQDSSEMLVCSDTHYNATAPTGSIDVLIPSDWWRSGAPVHNVPTRYVPPLESLPDYHPGKIVGCGPYNGYIQYSIWGPPSDDPNDIDVSVRADSTRLVVQIQPGTD